MAMATAGRGPKRGGKYRRRPLAEINVTPMVDVMLVLLVVFMVAAPMMTNGVPVDLPKTNARAISNNDDKPLEISVDKAGDVYLMQTKVDIDSLVPRLTAIAGANKEARIYLRGDKGIDYGKMMQVLSSITNAGFSKVSLVSTPAPDAKKK
ncbi:protein TolR [Roseiterribacter gracilis]|uniref:Protein TolR n=1 Tax=Roseiterribacter gracilis TaxID=2812848 RepID=A0A8S8XBS3_9PROT|nr:protein TolR [Rhodospirillales bacterium TMPK1]